MGSVVFLDIDGVICLYPEHQSYWANNQNGLLSAICCKYLKEILDTTGAKIVLTSSWRLSRESLTDLHGQLEQYGIMPDYFGGSTEDFSRQNGIQSHNHLRWLEIKDYIEKHKIVNYVILDDFNLEKYDKEHLIRTKMHQGLTAKLKEVSIRKLKNRN